MQIAKTENQTLIQSQMETLVRSRLKDLERGDYRSFVEGIGSGFSELYLQIDAERKTVSTGTKSASMSCSQSELPLYQKKSVEKIKIEMCRPLHTPLVPIAILVVCYILTALASLRILHSLERDSLTSLLDFVKSRGVEVKTHHSLDDFLVHIEDIKRQLDAAREKELEWTRVEAINSVAQQVAHDIRSPLAALKVLESDLSEIPAESRNLLKVALTKISSIADDFLVRYRNISPRSLGKETGQNDGGAHRIPLSEFDELIQALIQEKKVEYSSRPKISIESKTALAPANKDAHVRIRPIEMIRILSNLINNAIEALGEGGLIEVAVLCEQRNLSLVVSDNGRGIPSDRLPNLGNRGVTYGKPGGSGLGLHYAKSKIESWGGRLEIESKLEEGTRVRFHLPVSHK